MTSPSTRIALPRPFPTHARDRRLFAVQSDRARASRATAPRHSRRHLKGRGGEPVWLIHDEIYREQTFVDDAADLAVIYP